MFERILYECKRLKYFIMMNYGVSLILGLNLIKLNRWMQAVVLHRRDVLKMFSISQLLGIKNIKIN